ncbi:MAG: hypothetical protein Q9188_000986 [Gyalolechia gomerana]
MGRERRRWTPEEDSLLREAVRKATQEARPLLWRELAKKVPGRTNKDCRRRWCNILADGTAKGPWTESEDERLSNAVRENGPKWTRVAALVGTRNSDQCSSHWSLSLNPDIDYSDWTRVEDERLLQAVKEHGTNWTIIAATSLPNRTTLALKNRYSSLRTKISQIHGTPRSQAKPETRGPRAYADRCRNNKPNTHASAYVPTYAQEPDDPSDECDDDDEDNDEEDKELDDDDQDDIDSMALAQGPSSSNSERHDRLPGDATTTRRRTLSSQSTTQTASYRTAPSSGTQQDTATTPATVQQWQEGLQIPALYPDKHTAESAPLSYDNNSAHPSALADMDIDFGALINFKTSPEGYPYQGTYTDFPQLNLDASYPAPGAMLDAPMNGVSYTAQPEPAHQRATNQNQLVGAEPVRSRRESDTQQEYNPLESQDMVRQAPATTDASPRCSGTTQCALPSTQNMTSSHSENLQESIHHVSVDAECTTDQLGSLMRTLVGATRKVVVKIQS